MKISYLHEAPKKVNFCEVSIGEAFLYDDTLWIKTDTLAEGADNWADEVNAICLENGDHVYFDSYETVIIPKEIEINVKW